MLNKLSPTIAIVDSGIGGISVLNKLIKRYQSGNYIYFADNLYMPYGTKSKAEIKERILNIIDNLKQNYQVDMIIIACNTASSVLKNIDINGVIKFEFNDKKATYLTTPLTQKSLKNLKTISSSNLAREIEENIFNISKVEKIVREEIKTHKLNKLDSLILGCTHYELVEDIFKRYCPKTKVSANSYNILDKIIYNPNTEDLSIYFMTTKQDMKYISMLKSLIKN